MKPSNRSAPFARAADCAVPESGGVIVRTKLCIRCGECAPACPVDAVYLDQAGEPYVCIHCGRCVEFCPHDCLEMVGQGAAEPPTSEVQP